MPGVILSTLGDIMAVQITLTEWIKLYEQQYLTDVLTVTISGEQRVYGRTVNGSIIKPEKAVYAVIP